MGRYKRLLSNTAILGAGTFASKVLVFLLMPLYTGILSTSEYGTADILTQTANLLIPLASVGICDGLFRFVLDTVDADSEGSRARIFTASMVILAVGSALVAALSPLLYLFDVFDGYVWLVVAYVICANLHSAAANFTRAIGKTAVFATQGIINTVLTIVLNVVFLVVFDMGVLGYVLSVVISDFVITAGLFVALRLYRFIDLRQLDRLTVSQLLKFSLPYIPTTILWLITSASDRYIVMAYRGTAENGLYAVAYKLPTLILLVCGVFIEAWQFSVVKDTDKESREQFFSTVYKNYMGIIFVGASALIAGAKICTRILLDDSYYASWEFVPVLVMATAFSALVSFMGSVYFLEKKSVLSMLTAMSGAIINVILNFILVPKWGALGAAVSTFISYAAVYVIRAYDTRFYVKFKLHTPRLILNTVILLAQTVVMLMQVRYCLYIEAALFVSVAVMNGKDFWLAIRAFLSKNKKS